MPLFSNNYDTPGPGVSKNEAPKPGIIRYFIVIGRHFWDLGILNIIYLIASIPAILAYFFVAAFALPESVFEYSGFAAVCLGIMLPAFLGNGPVRMGMCYVLRNYSAEKHAFMWSDLLEHTKRNFLRGTVFFLINIVFVYVICIDINFYFEVARSGAFVGLMSIYFAIFIFLIYMVFSSYFYMITVSFDIGVKETLKRAFALTMGKFIQNIACLIVCLAFSGLILWFWSVAAVLMFIIGYSYVMLLLDMNSFSVVRKYMAAEEESEEE